MANKLKAHVEDEALIKLELQAEAAGKTVSEHASESLRDFIQGVKDGTEEAAEMLETLREHFADQDAKQTRH